MVHSEWWKLWDAKGYTWTPCNQQLLAPVNRRALITFLIKLFTSFIQLLSSLLAWSKGNVEWITKQFKKPIFSPSNTHGRRNALPASHLWRQVHFNRRKNRFQYLWCALRVQVTLQGWGISLLPLSSSLFSQSQWNLLVVGPQLTTNHTSVPVKATFLNQVFNCFSQMTALVVRVVSLQCMGVLLLLTMSPMKCQWGNISVSL